MRIEILVLLRQREPRISIGVHGSKRRKWIGHACAAIGIEQIRAEQRYGRTEGRILHEVVVQLHKRHDVEDAPATPNCGGMLPLPQGIRESQPRR